MKPIRTQPRFRCDFCKKAGGARAIKAHEKICFKNPKRWCDLCENQGYFTEGFEDPTIPSQRYDCNFCHKWMENNKMRWNKKSREWESLA